MDRRLIVNADDFGMTVDVSRGIIAAARGGVVRSTSAMASCPDFSRSMEELEGSGLSLDVGLHANLTWGRPISEPSEIPTLVDGRGCFLTRSKLLAKALVRAISPEEAYREMWAQAAKLASRRERITHLDGHHHVHAFPEVAMAAERVAREFGIPYVRAPREGLWSPWRRAMLKRFAIFMLAASGPGYWRSRGFLSSDNFGGFSLGAGPGLRQRWIDAVRMLPEGVCEIMAHPGYFAGGLDSYGAGREEEVTVLADPELIGALNEAGVKLVSPASGRSAPDA
ncbi:MAG: ChbG/HpnK family deacetylase [Proteobacteria bacterium]|nr:ChbG/HpnK family deacetylase [Pseudomonadota bacterium]